jgi:hypothetical protein
MNARFTVVLDESREEYSRAHTHTNRVLTTEVVCVSQYVHAVSVHVFQGRIWPGVRAVACRLRLARPRGVGVPLCFTGAECIQKVTAQAGPQREVVRGKFLHGHEVPSPLRSVKALGLGKEALKM